MKKNVMNNSSFVDKHCANPNCGKVFSAKKADVARGWAKCCSKACAAWKREKARGSAGYLDKHGARIYHE